MLAALLLNLTPAAPAQHFSADDGWGYWRRRRKCKPKPLEAYEAEPVACVGEPLALPGDVARSPELEARLDAALEAARGEWVVARARAKAAARWAEMAEQDDEEAVLLLM